MPHVHHLLCHASCCLSTFCQHVSTRFILHAIVDSSIVPLSVRIIFVCCCVICHLLRLSHNKKMVTSVHCCTKLFCLKVRVQEGPKWGRLLARIACAPHCIDDAALVPTYQFQAMCLTVLVEAQTAQPSMPKLIAMLRRTTGQHPTLCQRTCC